MALPEPKVRAIYGRITDGDGNAIAGAHASEVEWSPDRDAWHRNPLNTVTTTADGSYVLPIVRSPDAVVVFEHASAEVVWARVSDYRRIDVEIVGGTGVVAVFDGRITPGDPCAAWTCPLDHEPLSDWWLRPDPCPDGGHVVYALGPDGGYAAGVAIHCEQAGKVHGASTTWTLTPDHLWTEHVGWYEHGARCGQWRDSEPLRDSPGSGT